MTYGWCIDPDTHYPSGDPAGYVFAPGLGFEDNPDGFVQNFRDKLYSEPGKLDRVVNLEYDRAVAERSASFEVPFEGNIRNSAIHVAKLLGEAWDNQNHQDMIDYSTALAMLLNSWRVSEGGTASGAATGFSQVVIDSWNRNLPVYHQGIPGVQKNQITTLTPKKFEEITGYRYKKPSILTPSYLRNAVLFEWVGDGRIPEAAPGEYLTVAAPLIYDVNADQDSQYQRVLVGHQPGIPNWPGNEPKPNAFTPEVKTQAAFSETDDDTVIDTVSVSGLVNGGKYVLTGQLVSKADGKTVLGESEAKAFTANEQDLADFAVAEDGSVSGTITVEVPGASKIEAGKSAVVFETLTSSTVDKQGNPLDEGSDPVTIAEHKDINDAAQTVTRPEPEPVPTPSPKDEETKTPKPGPSDTPKNVVSSAPAPEKEGDELSFTGSAVAGLFGVSVLALAAGVGALLLRNRSKKMM